MDAEDILVVLAIRITSVHSEPLFFQNSGNIMRRFSIDAF